MNKFRVVRGGVDGAGRKWGIALTYEAETARDAVKASDAAERKSAGETYGGLVAPSRVAPVTAVYAMTLVPETDWR